MKIANYKYTHMTFFSKVAIFLAAFIFIVSALIYGFVSANGKVPEGDSFGIGADRASTSGTVGVVLAEDDQAESNLDRSGYRLSVYSERNISDVVSGILFQQQKAAKAAAEAARINELNHIAQAKNNRAHQVATVGLPPLSEINWDAGEAAFMNEWTTRINAYLSGSPLAGQGETFARAAWENGIDPRWSPAISNTESSKGEYCFLPHNAWGWGQSSWGSWEDAIFSHVEGLATKYGYSIAYSYAETYCPPNADNWYNNTLAQMSSM